MRSGSTATAPRIVGTQQLVDALESEGIAVEQIEEGGLGTGGSLGAAQFEASAFETQPLEIEEQLVQPQRGAFAHGGRLRRLQVGHPEARFRRPALGEVGERRDHRQQTGLHQRHGVAGDALLGVVADEAARGAEVENRFGRRRVLGVDVEVGHDIVPGLALDLGDPDEVVGCDLEIGAHLLDRLDSLDAPTAQRTFEALSGNLSAEDDTSFLGFTDRSLLAEILERRGGPRRDRHRLSTRVSGPPTGLSASRSSMTSDGRVT